MAPCLPPSIITTILSHLVPPNERIPENLLGKSLKSRLTFLPPVAGDLDSYLTPFARSHSQSSSESGGEFGNPIHDRLERLSLGYTLSGPVYTQDGEQYLSKIVIRPELGEHRDQSDDDGKDEGVMVLFEIEDSKDETEWKFHSTELTGGKNRWDEMEWSPSPENVILTPPTHDEVSAEEYWKGFEEGKSPSDSRGLGGDGMEDGEDDYWGRYGGATPGGMTPGLGSRVQSFANFDHLTRQHDRQDQQQLHPEQQQQQHTAPPNDQYGSTESNTINHSNPDSRQQSGHRVMCEMPSAKGTGTLDPLIALLSTLPDRFSHDSSPTSPLNGKRDDMRDKIQGRIKGLLSDLWAFYTTSSNPDDMEEKAYSWIRISRAVIDDSVFDPVQMDEIVVKAKMEVLREMWICSVPRSEPVPFGNDAGGGATDAMDEFWRCCESAIKGNSHTQMSDEQAGMTQETYWE